MTDKELLNAVAELLGVQPEKLDPVLLAKLDEQVQRMRQCDGIVGDRLEMLARAYLARL